MSTPIIQTLKYGLAAFLFVVTSFTLLAAPPKTGIEGQAVLYISYGTPVEEEPGVWLGVGDVQIPVATSFSVYIARPNHKAGRLVGHFDTDANGIFNVPLTPGKYLIVPDALVFPGSFGQTIPTGSFEVRVKTKNSLPALILYYQDGPLTIFSMQ